MPCLLLPGPNQGGGRLGDVVVAMDGKLGPLRNAWFCRVSDREACVPRRISSTDDLFGMLEQRAPPPAPACASAGRGLLKAPDKALRGSRRHGEADRAAPQCRCGQREDGTSGVGERG